MKLLKFERASKAIGDEERATAQAALDENRPFVIASKRPDNRWEISCWFPNDRVGFYELLGMSDQIKEAIRDIYDEEDE